MSEDDDYSYKLATARAELAWIAFELAVVKWFRSAVKAGFNPDQPRVPAGRPDGGQWTRDGGAGGRAELVQARPDRRYSVNLLEEEGINGAHTIALHVGKAPNSSGGGSLRVISRSGLSRSIALVLFQPRRLLISSLTRPSRRTPLLSIWLPQEPFGSECL